MKVHKG